jgi:hypothetical protein
MTGVDPQPPRAQAPRQLRGVEANRQNGATEQSHHQHRDQTEFDLVSHDQQAQEKILHSI